MVRSPDTANDNIQVPDPQNTVTVATHSRWAGGRDKLSGLASLAPKSLPPSTWPQQPRSTLALPQKSPHVAHLATDSSVTPTPIQSPSSTRKTRSCPASSELAVQSRWYLLSPKRPVHRPYPAAEPRLRSLSRLLKVIKPTGGYPQTGSYHLRITQSRHPRSAARTTGVTQCSNTTAGTSC